MKEGVSFIGLKRRKKGAKEKSVNWFNSLFKN
jgi:hypothetical protein